MNNKKNKYQPKKNIKSNTKESNKKRGTKNGSKEREDLRKKRFNKSHKTSANSSSATKEPKTAVEEIVSFGVRHLMIDESFNGQRIDNYLRRVLPGLPKSRLYQMIRKGEVRLNKKRVKVNSRVTTGDDLRVPPIVINNNQKANVPDYLIRLIKNSILHQDENFLIINKPAGTVVHSGSDHEYGLIDIIHQAFDNKRWELCHRLDKDTSGCLVLANNRKALNHFQKESMNNKVHKQYLALVKGRWLAEQQLVDDELDKKESDLSQSAQSIFTTREIYQGMSLMKVVIKTGRTHQIRRHAKMLNHPVAMDVMHGDFAWNKILKTKGLNRMFLHSHIIKFRSFEETIHVSAEIPESLENFIESL